MTATETQAAAGGADPAEKVSDVRSWIMTHKHLRTPNTTGGAPAGKGSARGAGAA